MFTYKPSSIRTLFISTVVAVLFSHNSAAEPTSFPQLPQAVANNAIARVSTDNGYALLSFMGLGARKDYTAVHNQAWVLHSGEDSWQSISPVPSSITPKGRLASIAVGVNGYAYLFGGYTVDKDHNEISSPDVFRYHLSDDSYTKLAPMPVPVDDSVALVYKQRYIYLVSGWHNDGNVNLVQVYDTETDTWQQASPFLAPPVFGHAGVIVDNQMIVCDGVKVIAQTEKRRTFAPSPECLMGTIYPDNHLKINWQKVEHPTGVARYRMAATDYLGSAIFIGGSDNPYNYDGIGYNGEPSMPSNQAWLFSFESRSWEVKASNHATMDHRGLININGTLITIGGMESEQQVSNKVTIHRVE